MNRTLAIAIAASVFALGTPGEDGTLVIQVTPDGEFLPVDGRKMDVPAWRMNAANAEQVIAAATAHKTPLVIDYEHQTLHKEKNGQPAPAAAWFRSFEYRPGEGLFAQVKLTRRAAELIAEEELAYFSPVFGYDAQGNVMEVLMGGFTNTPAIDGMQALAAAAAQLFAPQPQEDSNVEKLLAALRKTLGLADDANEEAVAAAVTKLQEDKAAADTAVAAATAQIGDPAKFVPIDTFNALQGQVAALSTQLQAGEIDVLIQDGMEAGKLTAATEQWARNFGKQDVAGLRTWLDGAPAIAALTRMQSGGKRDLPASGGDDPMTVAAAARKYQDEQAKAGITVSVAAAVAHVSQKKDT